MLNKILLSVSIVSLVVGASFASVNNTITTKGYVDTEIDTKQLTIPAAGAQGVGAGNTVVTYTSTEGTLGERELYTGANDYDAESDADKLITASALNGAFTNLPTLETNRLACANQECNLWTITPQTAYGKSGGGGGINIEDFVNAVLYGELIDDDKFEYNGKTFNISVDWAVSGDGQQVAGECTGSGYCYCRLASPVIPNPQWIPETVYGDQMNCDDSGDCEVFCDERNADFIRSLFGVQQ